MMKKLNDFTLEKNSDSINNAKFKTITNTKTKASTKQVLQARLLQLNTINLEQAIIKELEQNPTLEQVEPEDIEEKTVANGDIADDEIDAPLEDIYTDESSYYLEQEKGTYLFQIRHSFIENIISQIKDSELDQVLNLK